MEPVMGLLGRNGSDFSAAIVGYSLGASKVEFWTDVDGIYTADPRVVKDAILVKDMSYEEAMELSFFGSKVLHPKTLSPLASKGIEAWSLNSHNPSARGTRIGKGPFEDNETGPVRGISCLKDCAMISVSGSGMKGRKGMAAYCRRINRWRLRERHRGCDKEVSEGSQAYRRWYRRQQNMEGRS